MTSLHALWLPMLLSAVLVFLVSSVIHMASPWHKNDYPRMPHEDEFRAAVGPLDLPPGDYMIPRAYGGEEMRSDAYRAKWEAGPNVIMTVMPRGWRGMGRSLALWFLYLLVVAHFGAYVASRTLAPGTEYLQVFRVVGVVTFVGFSIALLQMSIWYQRSWSITIKSMIDGLIYGLLMAGVFAWLWPAA